MRIIDLIQREMIVSNLSSTDRNGVIRELATHLAEAHEEIELERLVKVLRDREDLASTAIGHGVAIPHGKLAEITEIRACIGRAPDGVEFDSMDGKPTHIFIVMVAPENSSGSHLKALARISRVFKGPEILQHLLEASDADEIFDVLIRRDSETTSQKK